MRTILIREVPSNIDPNLRGFLMDMRDAVRAMAGSYVPPEPPSNLTVTPIAGGNRIQFTRSDADYFVLYHSDDRDIAHAVPVDIRVGSDMIDDIGKGGVTRYYWLKSKRISGVESGLVGPASGTSLGLAVASTPPAPPAPTLTPTTDLAVNYPTYGYIRGGRYEQIY